MTPNPLSPLPKQRDGFKWLMIALIFVISYCLFYQLTQRSASDISIHTTWAGEGSFRDPSSFLHHGAHPLWHMLVVAVTLTGLPLEISAALVTALCKAAEVWLIHRLFRLYLPLSRRALTLLTAICATVSCLCLPCYNPTVYLGVGTPNTWHSCTQLIAMLFMLVCVPYTAYCYDHFTQELPSKGDQAMLPWREPVLLGVLLLVSLLAKPTFMQAFLPAACLFFLYQWIRHPKNSRFFWQVLLCVLPAILFMIVQYMYYFGIIVPYQAGMVLQISAAKCLDVLIRVVLMLAFPIYALILTWREGKRDTFFVLTLIFTLVSIAEFLILGEDGRRAADGNFGWGMMGAVLMLWVVAMIRYFTHGVSVRRTNGKLCPARLIGHVLLAWHLLSGLYYIYYLFVSGASL